MDTSLSDSNDFNPNKHCDACMFITSHLSDPNLSVAAVAAHTGLDERGGNHKVNDSNFQFLIKSTFVEGHPQ